MFRLKKETAFPVLWAVAFSLIAMLPLFAAKTASKPAPSKPSAAKRPPVMGTQPLKGDQAVLGQTYTLGKENPINIAVTSVRYSVERLTLGESRYVANANEKLLVIEFMLQNPVHNERLIRFDTVSFTAVDSKDINHESPQVLCASESGDDVNMNLKPGQRKNVYTYIVLTADVSVPKLIVRGSDALVLRYDLRGKIKPLTAPFADPKDASGTVALGVIPVSINTPLQVGNGEASTFDIVVEKVAYVDQPLGEVSPEEEKRLLVMTARVTNRNHGKALFRYDSMQATVLTEEDERIDAPQDILAPSSDRSIEYDLEKEGGGRFRMYFQVPKDAKVKTLIIRLDDNSRAYAIGITGVQ